MSCTAFPPSAHCSSPELVPCIISVLYPPPCSAPPSPFSKSPSFILCQNSLLRGGGKENGEHGFSKWNLESFVTHQLVFWSVRVCI